MIQVGGLVKTRSFGGIGIVLQIAPEPSNLVQIKWLDGGFVDDDDVLRCYWYHPSNLEDLCKSET